MSQPRKTIATSSGSPHARILGVGGYRPTRVVTNEEICATIDSTDQWIRDRSGIVTRHWAGPDESLVDMAVAAGGKALAHAGVSPDEVGAVLVATVTHFLQTPSAAVEIGHRLGTGRAPAMDLSAACAGFSYGVSLASDMVRAGSARTVLVIGAARLSDLTDRHDRGTAFLFGDGAGAVLVGPSSTPGIGPTIWGSDGSAYDTIRQRDSWKDVMESRLPWPNLVMEGPRVFRWAVWEMAPVVSAALEAAGITAEDLDAFIPHQANMRIIDSLIKAIKLPPHVPVARDIAETGNTSAASIPLAMERMLATGEAPSGGLALIMGFGAGLVYGAQVVTLP